MESFVASVTSGPEEFFANILLEDVSELSASRVLRVL